MPRLWKFFALDSAKYVVTECLWAAKELGFGTAHRDARVKLERDKVQCANKIGQLEESIFGGAHILCKFDIAERQFVEDLMEHVGYDGLSAVVVYLNGINPLKHRFVRRYECLQFGLEFVSELRGAICIPFVCGNAFIPEIHLSCEGHHAGEDTFPQSAIHKFISLLPADKGSGVEYECLGVHSYLFYGAIHFLQLRGDVHRLIMEYHTDDVETRIRIREKETAGLVYKHAQFISVAIHRPIALNSKWRKIISATYAETFPRIQVVPVFQPSPKCIVPNYSAWRNGVSGGNFEPFGERWRRWYVTTKKWRGGEMTPRLLSLALPRKQTYLTHHCQLTKLR